ncbi:MAG: hypothetical protein IJO56_09905 [Oscillospiraceae bacterium]|nr:hypothetical protein [Oscillospiraceae bacterium]
MKRLFVLILTMLLLAGCSSPTPIPISDLDNTDISLTSPVCVSFELPANDELKIPFNISITKNAIRAKFEGEKFQDFIVTLYRSDNSMDVAVATISEKSSIVTFTNLHSNYDYYIVVTNETGETSSLVLELSERMS